jgi:hypothetical protein
MKEWNEEDKEEGDFHECNSDKYDLRFSRRRV